MQDLSVLLPEDGRDDFAFLGQRPLQLRHRLHEMPVFSDDALACLIERCPRSHYTLILMDARGASRTQYRGEIGGLAGEQVIKAIRHGRMSLVLRNVDELDCSHLKILEQIARELSDRFDNFSPVQFTYDLQIASPSTRIKYHCDLQGEQLWQISGRRRVYVYPRSPPFVTSEQLEDIELLDAEIDSNYASWYDDYATVVDLEPGQMLALPLNAPHRIENLDGINLSMSFQFNDRSIFRLRQVNVANGLLRHRLGYRALSRAIGGPAYWSKIVVKKALAGAAPIRRKQDLHRVDFRLDATHLGEIIDLAMVP